MNCVLLLVSLFMLLSLRAGLYWAGGLEGNTVAKGREISWASSCPPFVQAFWHGVSMDVPPIFLSDVTTSKVVGLLSVRCSVQISVRPQTTKHEGFVEHLSSSKELQREYLKLGHCHILPHMLYSFFLNFFQLCDILAASFVKQIYVMWSCKVCKLSGSVVWISGWASKRWDSKLVIRHWTDWSNDTCFEMIHDHALMISYEK